MNRRRLLALTAASSTAVLGLAACSTNAAPGAGGSAPATSTVDIEDNHGTKTVTLPPQRVVATDNRLFETLASWEVKLAAAPVNLIAADNPYKSDDTIINLGSHREPDLEAVVAVDPDLILNGQRFASQYEEFGKLVPEAVIVELDPRDGEPFDAELKRQIEGLGTIFDRTEDATQLIADFDAAAQRVKDAYDPQHKVMAVITSGGEINYAAPGSGRTLGPVFDILGLTPAIKADGSGDHQGDDISVEAIAASNPDLILVMDRDAAVSANSGEGYTPANELLANSEALQNVTAIKEDRIVYMPQYTYVNEGIQTYTTFFNTIADKLEGN
ncbi:siderophore ABC transporter substrate-binding protein [Microlunatus sp. Y2014]|uniref:siderophore ABC transporter substrate-binding protein n=1 Tax=Microlunatus sp. Y2014 TaxID=3418488 RepID=UPI003DA78436